MAGLSGALLADFSSFQKACDDAVVKLVDFQSGANKVSTSLSKMVDTFSGRKIIQDATLAAEAVERIGGMSKLTEKQLQQLGDQAREAAAKMRAMGEDVPIGVRKLAGEFTGLGDHVQIAGLSCEQFAADAKLLLQGVTVAAGLVVAAFTAIGAEALKLGNRGADVNDLASTLDHFAGSASNAADILTQLRAGTLNTVDDFALMKESAHLLSAGVKLTADDFGTLGSAAFVLQNRGLGGTKDMLTLVSDALVTGRTKALSMALGVIDVTDAEETYARSLGETADHLSETGKVEAKRLAVMGLLRAAVQDAGAQERDFGEQIEAARTFMTNWVDQIGKAVATSPLLAAGMKAVGEAVMAAFGSSQQESITMVMTVINRTAVAATYLAQGAIEAARVVHTAFALIETIVLGVETAFMGLAAGIASTIATIAGAAAALPGATQGMKDFAGSAKDAATNLWAQAASLDAETKAAALGVIGHSAFDKTLDKLSTTVVGVRDAMTSAAAATTASSDATKIHAANTAQLARLKAEMAKSDLDHAKIDAENWKIQAKSLTETTALWEAYFAKRTALSGSSFDDQRAKITATFNTEVAKLNDSDKNWTEHYAALKANRDQDLAAVGSTWNSVRDKSVTALREMATAERDTYNQMVMSGGFYREELDKQLDKVHQAEDAARGWGDTAAAAARKAAAAAGEFGASWGRGFTEVIAGTVTWRTAMSMASASIDADLQSNIKNVRTLAGEYMTAADAKKLFDSGGSAAIPDLTNAAVDRMGGRAVIEQIVAQGRPTNPGTFTPEGIADLARRQASYDAMVKWLASLPQGAMGFDNFPGGMAMVGERGPELVNLPRGSDLLPFGQGCGGGVTVQNTIYVNGTAADVARQVAAEITKTLSLGRKFGTA